MKITVLLRMVPDVVEELVIAPDGKSLDEESIRLILSESDEHALEQALILKERYGAEVSLAGLEASDVDEALYTGLAKGADHAIKILLDGHHLSVCDGARLFEQVLRSRPAFENADLLLTGVQAISDLDSLLAPLLAHRLGLPFVGIVTAAQVEPSRRVATVTKEFPGGVRYEYEVDLPAVLGVQAAERPPRYLPVAKLRSTMKERKLEVVPISADFTPGAGDMSVVEMARPRQERRAEMLDGDVRQAAERLSEVLAGHGLL